jgi:hypothetical protein
MDASAILEYRDVTPTPVAGIQAAIQLKAAGRYAPLSFELTANELAKTNTQPSPLSGVQSSVPSKSF